MFLKRRTESWGLFWSLEQADRSLNAERACVFLYSEDKATEVLSALVIFEILMTLTGSLT